MRAMAAFADRLNRDELLALPGPIRAGLAHDYFECIHPFRDGNGRVGRLLERTTLLMSEGYKYPAQALDRYYLEHMDEYFLLFNQARKGGKPAPAFLGFVLGGSRRPSNGCTGGPAV